MPQLVIAVCAIVVGWLGWGKWRSVAEHRKEDIVIEAFVRDGIAVQVEYFDLLSNATLDASALSAGQKVGLRAFAPDGDGVGVFLRANSGGSYSPASEIIQVSKGVKITYRGRGQDQLVPRPTSGGPGEIAGGSGPEIWFVATASRITLEQVIEARKWWGLTRDLLRKAKGASL